MLVRTGRGGTAVPAQGCSPGCTGQHRGTLLVKKVGIAALAAVVLAFLAAGAAAALTTRSATEPGRGRGQLRLPVAYNGQDGWGHGAVRLSDDLRGRPGHVPAGPALVALDGQLRVRLGHPVGGQLPAELRGRPLRQVPRRGEPVAGGGAPGSELLLPDDGCATSTTAPATTGSAGAPTAARRSRCGSAARADPPRPDRLPAGRLRPPAPCPATVAAPGQPPSRPGHRMVNACPVCRPDSPAPGRTW